MWVSGYCCGRLVPCAGAVQAFPHKFPRGWIPRLKTYRPEQQEWFWLWWWGQPSACLKLMPIQEHHGSGFIQELQEMNSKTSLSSNISAILWSAIASEGLCEHYVGRKYHSDRPGKVPGSFLLTAWLSSVRQLQRQTSTVWVWVLLNRRRWTQRPVHNCVQAWQARVASHSVQHTTCTLLVNARSSG